MQQRQLDGPAGAALNVRLYQWEEREQGMGF
jgi:hypothetical protein